MSRVEPAPLFQQKLQEEFALRSSRNPRYSIRSWSRTLKIDAGTLSRVLRGKQIPSKTLAARLLIGINLSPGDRESFLRSIERAQVERPLLRRRSFSKDEIFEPASLFDVDKFHLIADWYHVAILELTHVHDWDPAPRWIAKRLGVSESTASSAVERLVRLGLLSFKRGRMVKTNHQLSTMGGASTNAALRKGQSDILQKASEALETQSISERSMTAMTMAIDPSRIEDARKLIREFNRKICTLLETGSRERVYTLEIALFCLDQKDTEDCV